MLGFLGGSDGKESVCSAGEPSRFSRVRLWSYGLERTRLPCPWDSPSKNTGVGCHAPLQGKFPVVQETWVQSLGQEDALEKEMATHSSILVWRIPWTEEPGELQYMGLQSWTQLSN